MQKEPKEALLINEIFYRFLLFCIDWLRKVWVLFQENDVVILVITQVIWGIFGKNRKKR